MDRVLSIQMARGFGESSEFVTKRMCFSFLFSVGFLCLLCGFLTGRFAAGRAVDMRTEKARLQLAGNGLDNEEHLREFLVQRIHENFFTANYSTDQQDEFFFKKSKSALEDLELFNSVVGKQSCIAATIRGIQEPDRYVVLSTFGEGVTIVHELSKAFKFLKDDYDWSPRRTVIFMTSLDSSVACRASIEQHVRSRVVSYIELDVESISTSGHFITVGSDIVQSEILQASAGVKNPTDGNRLRENPTTPKPCNKVVCPGFTPRLELDIPSALIKFVNTCNSSSVENSTKIINDYRRAISEVIVTSMWRLSEMTLFRWDPRDENESFVKILESLKASLTCKKTIETIVAEIKIMNRHIGVFNEKIGSMETMKSLDVRMANDLSMQVRRLLLCNDQDLRSRTDSLVLRRLNDDLSNSMEYYLHALSSCYKTANQLLLENIAP